MSESLVDAIISRLYFLRNACGRFLADICFLSILDKKLIGIELIIVESVVDFRRLKIVLGVRGPMIFRILKIKYKYEFQDSQKNDILNNLLYKL